MSQDEIELDYGYMMQNAVKSVIRDVLQITADLGDTPGDHHFYIEFMTTFPGVEISEGLLGVYPERMTIVLQHKFEDLSVHEDHFEVTLHFNGIADHLVIPFSSILAFQDPSTQFALRFEVEMLPEDDVAFEAEIETLDNDAALTDEDAEKSDASADVVSLDSFRKK